MFFALTQPEPTSNDSVPSDIEGAILSVGVVREAMIHTYVFGSLRLSLLAAIGATTAAGCGGTVEVDGGAAGTGGAASKTCVGATPILRPNGQDTGFFACPDGTKHRATVATCEPSQSGQACIGDEVYATCLTDADCTDRPWGRCLHGETYGPGGSQTTCGCSYACATDDDCGEGQICACSGVYGESRCIAATCKTNDDCVSGECSLSVYDDGCGTVASLHCRTATDTCRTAGDCPDEGSNVQCAVDNGGTQFSCLTTSCAIGRPLLVDGSARATRAAHRGDWSDGGVRPDVDDLPPEIVSALAARWSDVASMEHASVASFARFTLQLMALGAPSELLAATQQAAADEVEHARLAYAVASGYAGALVGPSGLDVSDVRIETDRTAVLRGLIEEACVGEAIGVAEARAYADAARDPVLATILARIADDEERHAALAWRTLRWMLHGADERTITVARESFDRAMQSMRREPSLQGPVAREHGLWSASEIAALRGRALDEVVAPCARALFDEVCA